MDEPNAVNDNGSKKAYPLSTNLFSTSPIGYLSSDPFAFIINLHWDQRAPKKCQKCGLLLNRVKFRKHVLTCSEEAIEEVSDAEDKCNEDTTDVATQDIDMKAEQEREDELVRQELAKNEQTCKPFFLYFYLGGVQ